MSSNIGLVLAIVIIVLIVVWIIWTVQKKNKNRAAQFKSICEKHGFNVNKMMQRSNRMAALDDSQFKVALFNGEIASLEEPQVVELIKTEKAVLQVNKERNKVLKVILRLPGAQRDAGILDLIFYDWTVDNDSKAENYLQEAKEWEKEINER